MTINSSQIDDSTLDIIWSLLDYGWLSDQARPSTLEANGENELAQTSAGDGAIDANLMAQPYDLVGDFEIDSSITAQNQISLDYLAFVDNPEEGWPVVDDQLNFSNEIILPSPWTPHFVE